MLLHLPNLWHTFGFRLGIGVLPCKINCAHSLAESDEPAPRILRAKPGPESSRRSAPMDFSNLAIDVLAVASLVQGDGDFLRSLEELAKELKIQVIRQGRKNMLVLVMQLQFRLCVLPGSNLDCGPSDCLGSVNYRPIRNILSHNGYSAHGTPDKEIRIKLRFKNWLLQKQVKW